MKIINYTKKNLNFKPYIKHNKHNNNNNNNIKHIYIKNNTGFGNKIYDLIFAIYLYNLYNNKLVENIYRTPNKCIINYVIIKSKHENVNDPTIDNIFINSKLKVNFINERQYQNVNKNTNININKIYNDNPQLQDLNSFPKYEELSLYNKIDNNFKLVYEMYKTFSQKDKDIFLNINNNILTDKTALNNIVSQSYSLVHIRYGDKLQYLNNYFDNPDINISELIANKSKTIYKLDYFLLYTPEYYIHKINELIKNTNENMKIYIITDSVNIAKQFIMNIPSIKDNSRIVLLDKMTWWDSFYLFYYASNIILSTSTFCFAGAYFNKKKANCELVLYHHDETEPIAPEEYSISPYWKIIKERKYILNYNPKIAYIISKFKYFWTD